jgi:hypothetical protein
LPDRRYHFLVIYRAPLVWLFYFNALHVGSQSTLLIVLKQSVNGVFNALLASAVHLLIRLWSKKPHEYPSFQEILFITIVTIILIPSFIDLVFKLRDEIHIGQVQIRDAAIHTTISARSALDQWLRVHHQDVKLLTTLVGSPASINRKEMQHFVELVKQSSPAFLRMGVLDRDAVIVAYSPLAQNGTNIGMRFCGPTIHTILRETLSLLRYGSRKLADKVRSFRPRSLQRWVGYCVGISDLYW